MQTIQQKDKKIKMKIKLRNKKVNNINQVNDKQIRKSLNSIIDLNHQYRRIGVKQWQYKFKKNKEMSKLRKQSILRGFQPIKPQLINRSSHIQQQQQQQLNESISYPQQTLQQLNKIGRAQQLITKIIQQQDSLTQQKLINKFNISYLIRILDKNKLQAIDKIYTIKPQGFNLLQFIRFFLNAIQHLQTQTLYLTMGLVDLFKAIVQANNSIQRVKFIHLTDFICNIILNNHNYDNNITGSSNSYSQNKIDMKLIPQHNKFITPNYQIKPYIINPPKIYGNKDQQVYKLSQSNIKTDKNKHDSVVTNCYFSYQYKKVFSLDALAQAIYIYDANCKLQKKLKPQNLKIKKDVVLLSFAYSQRQQRIGAVLKDFTLSFWDFNDNLQFQKVISTASSCQQYQTNIWYLEYFQSWITSDKTGIIYIWNLQKQLPQRKIQCKFKGKINDVCEIPCLNILVVAQQCRNNRLNATIINKQAEQTKIILYDYFRGQQISEISINDMRIPHTLQYSQNYQVLLSAGYEKKINIFEINHQYLDTNLKGQLLGHQNLITHFTLVKKTPMVVSCDDKGKVKIWDLRSYKCIQTLDFRDKTVITRLLDMVQIGKFGVLGSRINFLQYDQRQQIIKKYQTHERITPLNINFIYQTNKLLVVTKKDLRVYNMHTGGIQKVFCEYHTKDEQIVIFKYYELMKKILITNEKGEIKLISLQGGTMSGGGDNVQQNSSRQGWEERLQGYANGTVTHVEYDQQNKLFLTCGGNGTINIHKLIINNTNNSISSDIKFQPQEDNTSYNQPFSKKKSLASTPKYSTTTNKKQSNKQTLKPIKNQQWTIIRQMKGNFFNKDINTLAFSVYHGMIAIGSNCSDVYIWDYEYAKLLFVIQLPLNVQPTAMSFINGFSILLIAGSNGEIYFVKLLRPNDYQFLNKSSNVPKVVGSQHLLTFKDNRQLIKNNKSNILQLTKQQDQSDYVTEILIDLSLKGAKSKSQSIQFGKVYMAYNSGKIVLMQLSQLLKTHTILPHRKTLPTYNSQRQLKQQFAIELQKQKTLPITIKPLQQSDINKRAFKYPYQFLKPHSGSINSMKILQFDRHYLVTCGNDQRIKIWNDIQLLSNGNQNNSDQNKIISKIALLGDFNVNHPLPYLWDFEVKDQKKMRDKIMFSLKIIQSIFKKFGSDISTGQSKILKLEKFFKSLSKNANNNEQQQSIINISSINELQSQYLTQPQQQQQQHQLNYKQPKRHQQTKKPYLFQQQFSKKDLHYQQIKKYNFYQIGGPSLRQLQFRKKMDTMQKQWQLAKQKQQQQKNQLMSKIIYKAQMNQQKQQIMNFLQDRRLLLKNNNNNRSIISTNNSNNCVSGSHHNRSSTTLNNNFNSSSYNSNNNCSNNHKQQQQPQQQQQFPAVKRITQQLKRIQTQQQKTNNKDINTLTMNNTLKMHTQSYTFLNKFANTTGGLKMATSIIDNNSSHSKIAQDNNKNDNNYGQLLRKYYNTTKSSKSITKSINPKGFQEYYSKKLPSKSNFQQQQPIQRMQKIPISHSKSNSTFSLINSRSFSHQSIHKKGIANKTKFNQHLSFQNILKDMNNRVLLSRQGRSTAIGRTRQQQQSNDNNDNARMFQYPTQRQKRTKRLAKTTHFATQPADVPDKIN